MSRANTLHNARAVVLDLHTQGEAVFDRLAGGRAGTLRFDRAPADAFCSVVDSPLVGELERVLSEPEQLAGGGACR